MRKWGPWWLLVVACNSHAVVDVDPAGAGAGGGAGEAQTAGAGGDAQAPGGAGAGGTSAQDAIDCSALYDGDYGLDEGEYVHDSATCGAGEYCVLRPIDPGPTTYEPCAPVPDACPTGGRPACGEDGKHYQSACAMHRARMDFASYEPRCPDDVSGYYRCGNIYCQEGVEYCAGRGWQNNFHLNAYECVASECVAEGGCDCVGEEEGIGGQGGADWGSCSDATPRRIYVQRDGFTAFL